MRGSISCKILHSLLSRAHREFHQLRPAQKTLWNKSFQAASRNTANSSSSSYLIGPAPKTPPTQNGFIPFFHVLGCTHKLSINMNIHCANHMTPSCPKVQTICLNFSSFNTFSATWINDPISAEPAPTFRGFQLNF